MRNRKSIEILFALDFPTGSATIGIVTIRIMTLSISKYRIMAFDINLTTLSITIKNAIVSIKTPSFD
jgi:hypothetical protein